MEATFRMAVILRAQYGRRSCNPYVKNLYSIQLRISRFLDHRQAGAYSECQSVCFGTQRTESISAGALFSRNRKHSRQDYFWIALAGGPETGTDLESGGCPGHASIVAEW